MANKMNVGFLYGKQQNLKSLSTYAQGSFYLTDEDRLYFAKSDSELAYLNKSIIAVADTTELFKIANPIPGEFYYVKDGNILCYYSANADTNEPNVGSNGNWIQVNVDTNTDIKISKIAVSDAKLSSDGTALEMTCTVTRTDRNGSEVAAGEDEDLEATFKITGEQINSFVEKVTVDVSIGSAANSTAIALGGQGTGSVELKEGSNISLDGSKENEITISAVDTTYSISNIRKDQTDPSTEVILKDNDGTETAVAFEAGTTNKDIEVSAAAGKIVVSHADYDDIAKTGSNAITAGKFKAITGITTTNGHITEVEESEFTLPDDAYAKEVKIGKWTTGEGESVVEHGEDGQITIILNNGTEVPSGQDLYYTIADENDAEQKYYNQASLTEAIKSLIQNNFTSIVDAMTFKGSVANADDLAAKTPAKGDVYIVKGTIEKSEANKLEEDVSSGDIIIANGTETDGVITSGLEWIVVPGFEVDTTYTLSTTGNAIHLKDNDGNNAGTISLEDDDIVLLTSKEVEGTYSIKAEHATVTKNDTNGTDNSLDYSEEFSAITGVTYDDHGHVSGVETTKFTIPVFVDQTHTLANNGNVTQLKDADATVRGEFSIDDDNASPITVTASKRIDKDENNIGTDYEVEHNTITVSRPEAGTAVPVAPKGTITVVTGITDDGYGHMDTITTKTYELPGQNTLDCVVASVDNGASITHKLKDAAGTEINSVTDKYLSSNENLTITADPTNHEIEFNLIWGTF